MRRMISAELRKLAGNRFLWLSVVLLLVANFLLIWVNTVSAGDDISPKAYRLMEQDLRGLTLEQQGAFIENTYQLVYDMHSLEEARQAINHTDFVERKQDLMQQIVEINKKHPGVYESGDYLRYTDNLQQEFRFLTEIRNEYKEVSRYPQFLYSVKENTKVLSEVSIFNEEGSYEMAVINKTAEAYENIGDISINYAPQKGISLLTGFYQTDFLLILGMLFLAFVLGRQERDQGMLRIVRSTVHGRSKTAVAKLIVFSVGALVIVALLYSVNLVFSGVFGLGNLGRSIQSVPILMRSTLQISVWQYLLLFITTKWLCVTVLGFSVLIAVLLPQKPFAGYMVALIFPAINYLLREIIPATSKLNILKYANAISLLRINELLGNYRLLYFFDRPVSLRFVETVYGAVIAFVFIMIFCLVYSKAQLMPGEKRAENIFPASIRKYLSLRDKRLFDYEIFKIMFMNGVFWIMIIFVAYQGYQTAQKPYYIDADEMYYQYYMKHLEGSYTEEDYEWLLSEREKFEPIYILKQELNSRRITQEEYDMAMAPYYSLELERIVYERVVSNLHYVNSREGLQIVYDTGYKNLFGFSSDDGMETSVIVGIIAAFCFSGVFPLEESSGMEKFLRTTPYGQQKATRIKIYACTIISVLIALLAELPKYWQVIRDYGIGALYAPLASLQEYANMPIFISIIMWIIITLAVKATAVIFVCYIILALSRITKNQVSTFFISALLVVALPVAALMGFDLIKWIGIYPLFRLDYYATLGQSTTGSLIVLGISILYVFVCRHYLKNYYSLPQEE